LIADTISTSEVRDGHRSGFLKFSWQQHADKHGNDADHHQQLDEREGPYPAHVRLLRGTRVDKKCLPHPSHPYSVFMGVSHSGD
jgi:hypothetical protein